MAAEHNRFPEKRYRRAVFVRWLQSSGGEFRLLEPEEGVTKAVVDRRDLQRENLKVHDTVSLFLTRKSAAGHWICRRLDVEDNPWTNGRLPARGETVRGKVITFVEDWLAIVDIDVDGTTIDAGLARDRVP